MRCAWIAGFVLVLAACEGSSAGPVASSLAEPGATSKASTVQRQSTPSDRYKADESGCLDGKVEACRRLADRFGGDGHAAGCGIERPGLRQVIEVPGGSVLSVRIKRTSGDTYIDRREFYRWIYKGCDLGDEDACRIARTARTLGSMGDEDLCQRMDPNTSALGQWQKATGNEDATQMESIKKACLSDSGECCTSMRAFLYHRSDAAAPTDLRKELREQAEAICEKTLDCGDVLMMLDKNGYAPEMVAPVREHAGKVLLEACFEGSCVCGDAVQYMASDDARRVDVAKMGCENGEAEGCYALGRLYEEGRGVMKDEMVARMLYEAACPLVRPTLGSLVGEYSPRACDRLAEMAEGGATPPKDPDRARYYAEFACLHPGFERDHAPCVRLAGYFVDGAAKDKEVAEKAAEILHGPKSSPVDGKECERPSVKALCKER